MRLIYNELITNAIIHGNRGDLSKKVELYIEIDYNTIWSAIKDDGYGFDYTQLLDSTHSHHELLSEHGRGLKLVIGLVDYIKWNDAGNEIIFSKHLMAK